MKAGLLFFALLSVICCHGNPSVRGKIKGLTNDTLMVEYVVLDFSVDEQTVVRDTIVSRNGRFSYVIDNDKFPTQFFIIPREGIVTKYRTYTPGSAQPDFLVFPGEKVRIKGKYADLKLSLSGSGSELVRQHMGHRDTAYLELEKQRADVNIRIDSALKAGDQALLNNELFKANNQLAKSIAAKKMAYIRKTPSSILSGVYLFSAPFEELDVYLSLVSEHIKEGKLKEPIAFLVSRYNEYTVAQAAEEALVDGAQAPEFMLPDDQGRAVSLSSLSGKYVVLDFWGTWCGPCIKGMPEMKKHYELYRDKVEFVSIACKDTPEDWKAGIKKYGMNWVNLFQSPSDDVAVRYGIMGYPTKLIIDPQGRIVAKFIGEGEDFYKALGNLFASGGTD